MLLQEAQLSQRDRATLRVDTTNANASKELNYINQAEIHTGLLY